MSEVIYLALVNPDIHESAYATISVHKTREGAERAIEVNKQQCKDDFIDIFGTEMYEAIPEHPGMSVMKWDDFKEWEIKETELLD